MDVIAIVKHQLDSWNGASRTVAIAENEAAALEWVRQETTRSSYAQGMDARYWIDEYPLFSFEPTHVFAATDRMPHLQNLPHTQEHFGQRFAAGQG